MLEAVNLEGLTGHVTTAFNRRLGLDGVWVRQVDMRPGAVIVHVALRRKRLACPHCGFDTASRYETRPVASRWRHLDLGASRLTVTASLRRLACPTHGVVVEGVPFARAGSRFTADFEDLVAWLASRTDKTAITDLPDCVGHRGADLGADHRLEARPAPAAGVVRDRGGRDLVSQPAPLPHDAERASQQLLSLPLYPDLTHHQQDQVLDRPQTLL